jgi:hypothetical protein
MCRYADEEFRFMNACLGLLFFNSVNSLILKIQVQTEKCSSEISHQSFAHLPINLHICTSAYLHIEHYVLS